MNLLEELGLIGPPGLIILLLVLLGEFLFYYFIIKIIVNAYRRCKNHIFFKNNVVRNTPTIEATVFCILSFSAHRAA